MRKVLGFLLAALATAVLLPSVASAAPQNVPPQLLDAPNNDGQMYDFAIKMNNRLFDWIAQIVNDIVVYDSDADCASDLEEILNDLLNTIELSPGVALTAGDLFNICLPDLPLIGTICIALYLQDWTGDNMVIKLTTGCPIDPDSARLDIEGDSGPVWMTYNDDALTISLIFDQAQLELVLDEPTNPASVEFTYPDGTTGTCDAYRAQVFRRPGDDFYQQAGRTDVCNSLAYANCPSDPGADDPCCNAAYDALNEGCNYADGGNLPSTGMEPGCCDRNAGVYTLATDSWAGLDIQAYAAVAANGSPDEANPTSPFRTGQWGWNYMWDYPDNDQASLARANGYGCYAWENTDDGVATGFDDCNNTEAGVDNGGAVCGFYASTCDLSNWVNLNVALTLGSDDIWPIQDLRLAVSLRPLFQGNETSWKANTAIGIQLQGLDVGMNMKFEWNNPNTVTYPQYQRSDELETTIPYIEAQLRLFLEDIFTCDDLANRPTNDPYCIGYFLGPTTLLDVNCIIHGLTGAGCTGTSDLLPIVNPLIPVADYGLTPPLPAQVVDTPYYAGIDIDIGFQSLFYAEQDFGAMIAGNAYIDIIQTSMNTTPEKVTTIANPNGISWPTCTVGKQGRLDQADRSTYDPAVTEAYTADTYGIFPAYPRNDGSHPYQAWHQPMIFQGDEVDWPDYQNDLGIADGPIYNLQGTLPVNSLNVGSTITLNNNVYTNEGREYMLGIGVHQDLITDILYELVTSGVLCIEYDPSIASGQSLLDLIGGFLTADNVLMSLFFPELPAAFTANGQTSVPLGLRVVPYLVDPNHEVMGAARAGWWNLPRAWTGGRITDVIGRAFASGLFYGSNNLPVPAGAVDVIGASATAAAYSMNCATQSGPYYCSTTTAPTHAWYDYNPVTGALHYRNQQNQDFADMNVEIPHLLVEFFAYSCSANCADADLTLRTLDAPQRIFAVDVGFRVGLDIEILQANNFATDQLSREYFIGLVGMPRLRQLFTYIEDTTTFAPLQYIDCPVVNNIDAPNMFNGGVGSNPCGDPANLVGPGRTWDVAGDTWLAGTGDRETNAFGAYSNAGYTVADAENFIGNILGVLLNAMVGVELRAALSLNGLLQLPLAPNGLIVPSPADSNKLLTNRTNTDYDTCSGGPAAVRDGCNYGDYLEVYLDISGSISAQFVFNTLDTLLGPDSLSIDVQNLLGFAPADGDIFVGANYPKFTPPETTILPLGDTFVSKTKVKFAATDDTTPASGLRYSWRFDNGPWTPFRHQTSAYLKGLYDGIHTFEVRAVDAEANLEPTPASVTFLVDGGSPKLTLSGALDKKLSTRNPVFYASAFDYVAHNDVTLHYSLDGRDWTATDGEIALSGLGDGDHTLLVRAADPTGNARVASHRFSVDSGRSFGCSSSQTEGDFAGFLLLLAPFGLFLLRRREATL